MHQSHHLERHAKVCRSGLIHHVKSNVTSNNYTTTLYNPANIYPIFFLNLNYNSTWLTEWIILFVAPLCVTEVLLKYFEVLCGIQKYNKVKRVLLFNLYNCNCSPKFKGSIASTHHIKN